MTNKTDKELQQERLAADIKAYLKKGGVVKTYAHDAVSTQDSLYKQWSVKRKVEKRV
jgi:hypothetical protein